MEGFANGVCKSTHSIRFSFGFFNTEADVDAALAALDILTKEAHHGL